MTRHNWMEQFGPTLQQFSVERENSLGIDSGKSPSNGCGSKLLTQTEPQKLSMFSIQLSNFWGYPILTHTKKPVWETASTGEGWRMKTSKHWNWTWKSTDHVYTKPGWGPWIAKLIYKLVNWLGFRTDITNYHYTWWGYNTPIHN